MPVNAIVRCDTLYTYCLTKTKDVTVKEAGKQPVQPSNRNALAFYIILSPQE